MNRPYYHTSSRHPRQAGSAGSLLSQLPKRRPLHKRTITYLASVVEEIPLHYTECIIPKTRMLKTKKVGVVIQPDTMPPKNNQEAWIFFYNKTCFLVSLLAISFFLFINCITTMRQREYAGHVGTYKPMYCTYIFTQSSAVSHHQMCRSNFAISTHILLTKTNCLSLCRSSHCSIAYPAFRTHNTHPRDSAPHGPRRFVRPRERFARMTPG